MVEVPGWIEGLPGAPRGRVVRPSPGALTRIGAMFGIPHPALLAVPSFCRRHDLVTV